MQTHIFDLWRRDLDAFLATLDEHEAKEEADRLKNNNKKKNVTDGGKKRGVRKPKPGKNDEGSGRKKQV